MSIASEPRKRPYPTHLDLPHTDDQPVENEYQPIQTWLLLDTLNSHLSEIHPEKNYFLGADCGIYFKRTTPPLQGCLAPDFYYVPGVPKFLDGDRRKSFVMWDEGAPPLLVIEYVSRAGSEERDDTPGTGKFWIYEQEIRAKYYLIWHPKREKLEAFVLADGRYMPMEANLDGRYSIPEMEAEFGIWEGEFDDGIDVWLRPWTPEGDLVLTSGESKEEAETRAESFKRRVNSERRRADAEKQRADNERVVKEKLAAKLRELGIDPDQV